MLSHASLVLLPILSLVGFASAIGGSLRLPFALALLPAIAVTVLFLMAGGTLGFLFPSYVVAVVVGLGLLLERAVRGRAAFRLSTCVTAGVFAVFLLAFYIFSVPLKLIFWDEFSHWATFPKYLLLSDRFPESVGEVLFVTYPPGLGLVSYYLTRLAGFNEGGIIFSTGFLQAACYLAFLVGFNLRTSFLAVTAISILAVLGATFGVLGYNWTTATADNILAYVAGASVAIYLGGKRSSGAVVASSLAMAMTCSVKDSGNLIAAAVGVAILLDQIVVLRQASAMTTWRLVTTTLKLVIPSLTVIIIWRLHIASLNVLSAFQAGPETVQAGFARPGFSEYASGIIRSFWKAVRGGTVIGQPGTTLPMWVLVLVMLAANAALIGRRAGSTGTALIIHGTFALGLLAYAGSLLFFYVFLFVPYEARLLSGIDRYLATYVMFWLVSGIALLRFAPRSGPANCSLAIWCVVALALGWSRLAREGPRADSFATSVLQERRLTTAMLEPLLAKIPSVARVYVISNGESGLRYYITLFELKPRFTNSPRYWSMKDRHSDPFLWCHSLGPPRFDGDIWSCDWPVEVLATQISTYDYVLIYSADKEFSERYGGLFPRLGQDEGAQLFKVNHEGDILKLVRE